MERTTTNKQTKPTIFVVDTFVWIEPFNVFWGFFPVLTIYTRLDHLKQYFVIDVFLRNGYLGNIVFITRD